MELTESTAKQELPACPVETTLTLISDKWKVLILPETRDGRPVEMGRKLSGTVPLIRLSIRKNNFQEENHASYFNDRHRRHDCML